MATVLQQRVHGHHQIATQAAQHDQKWDGNPQVLDKVHAQHQQTHGNAQGNGARGVLQAHARGCQHRACGRAQGHHPDQGRSLRGAVAQRHRGPGEHDIAQVARNTPKQRGGGQRNLPQLVAPQAPIALPKIDQQRAHAAAAALPFGGRKPKRHQLGIGAWNAQVEQRRQAIDQDQHHQGSLRWRVHAGQPQTQQIRRDRRPDQLAAQQYAQDDGGNGQPLNPAVGTYQLRGGQQLREDAVLGR